MDFRIADINLMGVKYLMKAKEVAYSNLRDAEFTNNELEASRWRKRLTEIHKVMEKRNMKKEIQ